MAKPDKETPEMSDAALWIERIGGGTPVGGHRPWPRLMVDEDGWAAVGERLAVGNLSALGLWADGETLHLAVFDPEAARFAIVSHRSQAGAFLSLAAWHPPLQRLERTIRDLHGLVAIGADDARPWLDHGRWPIRAPLGPAIPTPADGDAPPPAYPFLRVHGESLHQIPVGPVHAGIIEPGHFRFTANGETVVRLEERLGYVHKGTEQLMTGATIDQAAKLIGRISGDSTVAYALAFARAAEAATRTAVPARAQALRAVMAELERIANHWADIGAICTDAAFALLHARCNIHRERVMRLMALGFGHRFAMDRVVPGGVTVDLSVEGASQILDLVRTQRRALARVMTVYDDTASLLDRTMETGILRPGLARRFAAGGFVGRASGRNFDARRQAVYPPYDRLRFVVPVLDDGDVNARLRVRAAELAESHNMLEQLLGDLPRGPIRSALAITGGPAEGVALVESFRGDVLVWLRLDEEGRVARCHARDPSWFQWPLLEAVIEGNIVADFPLCNKSFNCSYSGHDL